ncbi:pseudouridine kinase [Nocardioides terrae]|uniref:Pseudouridine kinase n=1 Tax=Nocardioides terrae TaxID=574651 RepID=A0A1I1N4I5_9ACTN|nr:carbohydrate kinase family protein [Nocardioides terrae]SFC92266.1 pseudouridine kinase [Nocardioides terrae]
MSVVVLGGANVDLKARSAAALVPGTSNPGSATLSAGGVGRNIAENLARLGTPTALVTAIGTDALGEDLLVSTAAAGVDVSLVRRRGATGTYTAVLDHSGELSVAVADMAAIESLTPEDVAAVADRLAAADLVVVDANLLPATVTVALDVAAAAGVPVVVEPVSVPKAVRLAAAVRRPLFLLTPNREELAALTGLDDPSDALAALHGQGAELVWLRRGPAGSLLSSRDGVVELAPVTGGVVDVTGAGDAMLAAFCHFLLAGATPQEAARLGHAAAALTVAGPATVRPDLSEALVRSSA